MAPEAQLKMDNGKLTIDNGQLTARRFATLDTSRIKAETLSSPFPLEGGRNPSNKNLKNPACGG